MSPNTQRLSFEFNLEDHVKRTRKAANYLKQIYHSQDCRGQCQAPACKKVSTILSHVTQCMEPNCQIPGCNTTKSLLLHSKECCHSPFSLHRKTFNNNLPTTGAPTSTNNNPPMCMLCTIASSGYNNVPPIKSFSTDNIVNEEELIYQPLIHDEIISYNRIPFQELLSGFSPSSSPDKSPSFTMNKSHGMRVTINDDMMENFVPRAKTFSDSDFLLASSSSSGATTSTSSLSTPSSYSTSNSIIHD